MLRVQLVVMLMMELMLICSAHGQHVMELKLGGGDGSGGVGGWG